MHTNAKPSFTARLLPERLAKTNCMQAIIDHANTGRTSPFQLLQDHPNGQNKRPSTELQRPSAKRQEIDEDAPDVLSGFRPIACRQAATPQGFLAPAARVVRIRAGSQRTSRQALPSEPSRKARDAALLSVKQLQNRLSSAQMPTTFEKPYVYREAKSSGAIKGCVSATCSSDQRAANTLTHIAGLKSRQHARCEEALPSWFTASNPFPPALKGLAEVVVRGNAVGCAVTKRTTTMGGAVQIRGRVNMVPIERAGHAQHASVQTTLALTRILALAQGVRVVDQLGTTAIEPALLLEVRAEEALDEAGIDRNARAERRQAELFTLPCTMLCVNNARAHKIGTGSVVTAARVLASREKGEQLLSATMLCTGREALRAICAAVLVDVEWDERAARADPVWASIVLIVFLASHPRMRRLLSNPELQLTPLDVAIATVIEFYGRTELVRRTRLQQKKLKPSKKRVGNDKMFSPSDVREERRMKQRTEMLEAARAAQTAGAQDCDDDPDVERKKKTMLGTMAAAASTSGDDETWEDCGPSTLMSTVASSTVAESSLDLVDSHVQSDDDAQSDEDEEEEDDDSSVLGINIDLEADVTRGNCADPRAMIEFWVAQILQNTEHTAVIKSLVAVNRRSAMEAAASVLNGQACEGDLTHNEVLRRLAEDNSVRSAELLSQILGSKTKECLSVVVGNPSAGMPNSTQRPPVAVSIQEMLNPAAESTLMTFRRAPPEMTPRGHGFAIAHAIASMDLMPTDEEHATFPGVLERIRACEELNKRTNKTGPIHRDLNRLNDFVKNNAGAPTWSDSVGLTRTMLVVQTVERIRAAHARAAVSLAAECVESAKNRTSSSATSAAQRSEPLSHCSSRLAVALRASSHMIAMSSKRLI